MIFSWDFVHHTVRPDSRLMIDFHSLTVAYYYFFSSQVRRSIVYGDQPRNRQAIWASGYILHLDIQQTTWNLQVDSCRWLCLLFLSRFDLYLPKNSDGPKPVLAFVTGGAWIIGWVRELTSSSWLTKLYMLHLLRLLTYRKKLKLHWLTMHLSKLGLWSNLKVLFLLT